MNNILYIVIPCYKEEEVLPETAKQMKNKVENLVSKGKIDSRSRVLFVNDGSTDKTWPIIRQLSEKDKIFAGINLSRNRGHQNALLAGLSIAVEHADMIISIDADLQDDINAIDHMIDDYLEGYEVVYGVRAERNTDTVFKRLTAQGFYKIMMFMGANIVYNHADYRLMSKRALKALLEFPETNLFLRGMVPQVGFKSTSVSYNRAERFAGESKYPLKKMIAFAFEGITSFSIKPIRFILLLGGAMFVISIIAFLIILIQKLTGITDNGWASIMTSIWLLGGLHLLAIGIVGEYVGKAYLETKRRPRFFIEEIILNSDKIRIE